MEDSKVGKRMASDNSDAKFHYPVLVRVNKHGLTSHDIHIDKNEFKIGRARDNDEIILDTLISRRHCILRCEGDGEWNIKDLSSTMTFVNDVPLTPAVNRELKDGDIIQFSLSEQFRYMFTLDSKDKLKVKRPKLEVDTLDNVLVEQKTFAESQECLNKVLKDKLQIKQMEQDKLKDLLKQQTAIKKKTEEFMKEDIVQDIHLQNTHAELLEKLERERIQFEKKLNEERQKWQEALDVTKQEKEMLERKMREEMEKWREEQQAEWKFVMENKVKEEKNIQAQLLNEKTALQEKLKETEKALKEQETKVETRQNNVAGPSKNADESCIYLEFINNPSDFHIVDMIDLTDSTQLIETNDEKESVLNKVNDIMDEQLTCSICSELFINATTLNCMHTFCQYCIRSWTQRKKECPVCRCSISSMNRSIVLDNFIESMLENLPTRFEERRKEILTERQRASEK